MVKAPLSQVIQLIFSLLDSCTRATLPTLVPALGGGLNQLQGAAVERFQRSHTIGFEVAAQLTGGGGPSVTYRPLCNALLSAHK